MALFEYSRQVRRFLSDKRFQDLAEEDINSYINRARREIALKTDCIRFLTPIAGAITNWSVTNGGSKYSAGVQVAVSAPDFPPGSLPFPNGVQATVQASFQNGVLTSVLSNNGGFGYFQPQLVITDPTGSGAVAVPQVQTINTLNQGQEVYPFSGVNLSTFPGAGQVYRVQSISIIYANYRYSIPVYAFSVYQAYIRQYPFQYQYVPTFASQYGQGTAGSFYVYPLPSQTYQYELDCLCTPADLQTDQDVEALPGPWTDAVPYFAAHLAYLEIQNFNIAKMYLELFKEQTLTYSSAARRGRVVNPYGRF